MDLCKDDSGKCRGPISVDWTVCYTPWHGPYIIRSNRRYCNSLFSDNGQFCKSAELSVIPSPCAVYRFRFLNQMILITAASMNSQSQDLDDPDIAAVRCRGFTEKHQIKTMAAADGKKESIQNQTEVALRLTRQFPLDQAAASNAVFSPPLPPCADDPRGDYRGIVPFSGQVLGPSQPF